MRVGAQVFRTVRVPTGVASAFTDGGVVEVAFLVAFLSWLVSELVGSTILPQARGQGGRETSRADRGSKLAIFLGVFGSIVVVETFALEGFASLDTAWVYAGIASMFTGIAMRQWAIAVLGRYFSTSVRAVEGHRIVESGPYRVVRHPSYTGAIVTVVGIGLAGGSWEGVLVTLGLAAAVYGYRIHVEERFLMAQFGPEYLAYRQRTKAVIPYLL